LLTAQVAKHENVHIKNILDAENANLKEQANELRKKLNPEQLYLRGLFSGGTLCYEAQVIWQDMLDRPVYSNAPLTNDVALRDGTKSYQHTAVDLGEEEFTVGRPHPMIDNDLRIRRLLQEARDPQVAVIMLDAVLGYGAHPDPASELGKVVEEARRLGRSEKRELLFVASVTGTEDDPQSLSRTTSTLERAGVIVCNSNSAAARLAGLIVSGNRGG
jgi:FdrA protein